MPPELLTFAAPASTDLLKFSAPVELIAAPAEGKRPSFSIVAYTGVPMQAGGFYSPVILELSGVKTVRSEIPILLDHDPAQIVGQGTAKVDSAAVRIDGIVTGEDAAAQKVLANARNGFKWQASVGAQVTRREFLEAGKKAVVNGREVTGPMMIARESILCETSFVAIGADQQTSAAVAASLFSKDGKTMNFEQWLQAKGIDIAKIDDATKGTLRAAFDAEVKLAAAPQPTPAGGNAAPGTGGAAPVVTAAPGKTYGELTQIFAANAQEQARIGEVTRIAAECLAKHPSQAAQIQAAAELAIQCGMEPAKLELELLRNLRPETGGISGRRSSRSERLTNRVIEAAICVAAKLENVEKKFDEQTLEAAHAAFRGGIGLQEVIMIAAKENGCDNVSVRSGLEELLRAALPTDVRGSGMSSITLPNILSNVANKFVTEAFLAVESTWREITAIRPVNDFKQITNHSLTGDLQYEEVGPSGELKHGSLGEEVYTNQAKTFGKILAITRRDIVNDDLGAFAQVPRRLGRGGALKINDVFWTAFMANSSFFTSGNGNYDDGTDTALTADGLKAALAIWDAMTDPDGKPMGTRPAIILTPPGQYFPALALNSSTLLNNGATSNTPQQNVLAGTFKKVLKSAYLANSSYTGYSVVAYYLLCDPNDVPVIETCFLGGREQPTIETAMADFDVLGVKMRAYHDFGVTKQEKRGGLKLKGEA